MKKILLLSMLAVLGMAQAVAQEYEYVPFVREGVKWVYRYNNPFLPESLDMDEGVQYYSFELKGDVLLGDKHYKPVVLTHYLENGEKVVEDFTPAYLREDDKVVYAICSDGIVHPQCPVGYGWYISSPDKPLPITITDEEFRLYDFNDPGAIYDAEASWLGYTCAEYVSMSIMNINGQDTKVHHYKTWYSDDDIIIEGIGYDGVAGMPLFYFELFLTGPQVEYKLSHVIEDGKIIYKGTGYDPDVHVGVDEVVADRSARPLDPNYYNLMGQPVGKDVPTTPGIYIHQGKKIVVR